ncbi:hypothetical protein HHI36_010940 [Cryptolaemus montrouzieri]|uniref:F-box domain-containing protein n=1 Tax=Cryptolaemus montrouzieri TaxID=559131 RepID=A0ABD2MK95_9CUCU
MYFQLFPFAFINQSSFHLLPVELIALIFRYLDDDCLLNVFSTSRRWAAICRGDPILRNRIRNRIYNKVMIIFPFSYYDITYLRLDSKLWFLVSGGPMRSKTNVRKSPYRKLRL